jgi:diguanylate cyclase (GGDEF)-like protein
VTTNVPPNGRPDDDSDQFDRTHPWGRRPAAPEPTTPFQALASHVARDVLRSTGRRSEQATGQHRPLDDAPAPPLGAKLYLIGIAGEHFAQFVPLDGPLTLDLGRDHGCEVVIVLDDSVSRRHARLEVDANGRCRLTDLRSTNGTLVNSDRVTGTVTVERGSYIRVGDKTLFKVDVVSEEERAVWQSTLKDGLTRCYNRPFFDTRLVQLFEMSKASERPLSLLMVDVDQFRDINKTPGHLWLAGDHALRGIGRILIRRVKHGQLMGLAFRYGGDEFTVLLPGSDEAACAAAAEGLRAAVAETTFELEATVMRLTLSVGGATFRPGLYETPRDLVQAAAARAFRAKTEGGNRAICTD